ncbi:MAG: hypothetical protein KF892_09880 [Rhizobacter sp.]|nr:hypothetical protein [Rhizobacter sp.]
MSAIEFKRVNPQTAGTHIPTGWIAYRSTKTVAAMLAESVEELMRTEGLTKGAAEAELLRRALATLDQHFPPAVQAFA